MQIYVTTEPGLHALFTSNVPLTFREVVKRKDADFVRVGIEAEILAHRENPTWEFPTRAEGRMYKTGSVFLKLRTLLALKVVYNLEQLRSFLEAFDKSLARSMVRHALLNCISLQFPHNRQLLFIQI